MIKVKHIERDSFVITSDDMPEFVGKFFRRYKKSIRSQSDNEIVIDELSRKHMDGLKEFKIKTLKQMLESDGYQVEWVEE